VQHTTAVAIPAPSGGFHAMVTVQDVTALAEAVSQLQRARDEARQRASIDALTGVANRGHFLDMTARAIATARRYHRDLSLLMLDVDRFKVINDTYGHAAGDATLATLTGLCQKGLREGDLLGRLGGDEFAVLLPETPAPVAAQVAGRLRDALSASGVDWEGRRLTFEISVGVASLAGSDTVDELLARADEALYEAKRQGRNCVVLR
jgi:diguanylate cyclase (GGDEF)-like protein